MKPLEVTIGLAPELLERIDTKAAALSDGSELGGKALQEKIREAVKRESGAGYSRITEIVFGPGSDENRKRVRDAMRYMVAKEKLRHLPDDRWEVLMSH